MTRRPTGAKATLIGQPTGAGDGVGLDPGRDHAGAHTR
jgi:hypothetical protein